MALVVKAMIIGAAVGLASYTVGLALTGNLWRFSGGGALKAMFWGAVSGAVTFGVGELFSVAKTTAQTAFGASLGAKGSAAVIFTQASCHAVAQGALSMMQGGKFLSGATAGFLGHLGGAGWEKAFGNSDVGSIAFGALSGGVGAEFTGGNFWTGAITGGIVAGLNGVLHEMGNKSELDRQVDEKFGDRADKPAPANESSVNEALELPLLNHWNDASGNQSFTVDAENTYWLQDGNSEATTIIRTDMKNSDITYYKSSFKTFRHLAQRILHESAHAYFNYNGWYGNLTTIYNSERIAIKISEFYAYSIGRMLSGVSCERNVDYNRGRSFIQGEPMRNFPFLKNKN